MFAILDQHQANKMLVKVYAPRIWQPYVNPGVAVYYSTTNGINFTEYLDGVTYLVPFHVALGMVSRGWASLERPPSGANGQPRPPQDEPPAPPPIREPDQEETETPEPDNNDDDDREDARASQESSTAEVKHGRPNL